MAITIPVNDIAATSTINMEEYRKRVVDFATALWHKMVDEQSMKAAREVTDSTAALAFIQSLAVKGGGNIPTEEDSITSLIDTKYNG